MCGIAGLIADKSTVVDMQLGSELFCLLEHRGPDDQGWLAFAKGIVSKGRDIDQCPGAEAVLVHRRLSIVDLTETGWQPMSTPDGRYHIIFNGEIYNPKELRGELSELGYVFRSQSDTEVLLTAYAHWGPCALKRLIGMFALAILDAQARRTFLAREFFGIKPLYYTTYSHGFAFASEIKPLLRLPGASRRANPQRLYDYLRFGGFTDFGAETMFAAIQQLPAAHYIDLDIDQPAVSEPVCYWRIDAQSHSEQSLESAAEQLREGFLDNIRLHLRSDVPVGTALSGGIDSTAILMAMRKLEGPKLEIHAFSYVAAGEGLSEERWIDIAGQAAGAVVHKVRVSPEELAADLNDLIDAQGEPFGNTSIYAQYRIFKLAHAAGIKVMLDGQGADELFGGYQFYMAARIASLVRQRKWAEAIRLGRHASNLPGMQRLRLMLLSGGLLVPPALNGSAMRLIGEKQYPAWLNAGWFTARNVRTRTSWQGHDIELLREQLYQNFTVTSLPMLLRYEDRNSMAHSVESRVPFLTPAFVNLAFSLPEEYMISSDGISKAVFRRAMRGIVPDPILDRRDKLGFVTPERDWLNQLKPWIMAIVGRAADTPTLNRTAVEQELNAVLAGHKRFDFRIWRWLNLICWAERYAVDFA
jgi:asparagine synthase (glutamine-hydrolysing)